MKIRFLVFSLLLSVLVCGAASAVAQPAAPRFEVSGQASVLRLSDFGATNAGIGGRIGFDLSRWVTADAEVDFFPNDDFVSPDSTAPEFRLFHYRRRTDAFFGVRIGTRGERFGAFARVRPGFTRLVGEGSKCVGPVCALALFQREEYRTEFALDLGGGFEFYPSQRTVARVELGDTMIRHRSMAPPCWQSTCTSHNVATRFGMGLRF